MALSSAYMVIHLHAPILPLSALKGEGIKAGREAVKKKMAKKAVDAQEKAEEAADKAVTGA